MYNLGSGGKEFLMSAKIYFFCKKKDAKAFFDGVYSSLSEKLSFFDFFLTSQLKVQYPVIYYR